ncbi:hypothetical protein HYH03_000785 [Edaphochlamys debaryana]|uniref:Uncharacterized protein n=1 Tax=Edaphochlamys debaryana TaxID=47281 RepID=A0A835YGV1_9CHLO|nr:hypothetical protein HYH03_000785 [Edaphochlamys debaryana]|eukprot:KAG2500963.1 hypothetical protein HYH03_000785 [Edaphochlamys debaryana]
MDVPQLTSAIVEAEAKLAALFEPGKPMPRAGVVASLRQEVSEMKGALARLMGQSGPTASLDSGNASDEELAERARQAFLEVERLVGNKGGGRDDSGAIATLEAENERLRLEATALLMRQQQLEDLRDKLRAGGAAAAAKN